MIRSTSSRQYPWMSWAIQFALVVLAVFAFSEVALGQSPRSRTPGGGGGTDVIMFVRWGGLLVAVVAAYFMSFSMIFPTMLGNRTPPRKAFGVSCAVFIGVCTLATLALLWVDFLPARATRRTSALMVYKIHLIVLAVGFILTIAPLILFRAQSEE